MSGATLVLLETERMSFRQFRAGDARLLFELDGDPEVMRFISKRPPDPVEHIERRIVERILPVYRQSPPRGIWMAHLLAGGDFTGWFHLRTCERWPGEMELGYRLKRAFWGRGLATEGSLALLAKAFGEWGYGIVSAHTMASNRASRRVMEKCGLALEREFLYEADLVAGWVTEEERRAVKYSSARKDWLRLRAGQAAMTRSNGARPS